MKKNREFIQEILNSNLDTSIKGISEISKVKLKNIPKKHPATIPTKKI